MNMAAFSLRTNRIFQGDEVTFEFNVKNKGVAFNLSGYSIKMVVKASLENTSILFTSHGSITNAAKGQAKITLSVTNTNQDHGLYIAEAKISKGSEVRTLTQFPLEILKAVSIT